MKLVVIIILVFCFISSSTGNKYTPDWSSLDTHPLPKWYDDAKIGIIIHWGVYSVPAFQGEWFWWSWKGWPGKDIIEYMRKNFSPKFQYQDFASEFKAIHYNPDDWAELFKISGAKYVVLTSKHHEGFCLWPSATSWNWNSMDIGPKRDLVGELANSIRKSTDLKFGIYHSLFEWFNPTFLSDEASLFTKRDFVQSKSMPELYDLVNRYKPEIIWSDGNWIGVDHYWNSTGFIAWLYNESPVKETVVVNDRWGAEDECNHGDIHTCTDRYNPGVLQDHKWENAMTLDKQSWGFRKNMKLADVMSIEDLIKQLIETVSCGGNILINVGPTSDGIIVPIFEERLRQLGSWLEINGEGIYKSRPWRYQNDTVTPNVWYTVRYESLFAFVVNYPYETGKLFLASPRVNLLTSVTLLGYSGKVEWVSRDEGLEINMSAIKTLQTLPWTFKIENYLNS